MPVALGADDPLLFGPRLTAQYEIARHAHGFTDAELADLARASVLGSAAPEALRAGTADRDRGVARHALLIPGGARRRGRVTRPVRSVPK